MRMLAAAALAAAAFAPLAVSSPAAAQMPGEHRMGPVIEGTVLSLSAEGSVTAAPDQATVSLGVVTEGQTAEAAMRANATRMNGLIQALRRAGVAERDIQTTGLSVNPQYVYNPNEQPRITGYQANNQVTARVRDLNNLGRTLDAAVAAGGNTLNGVSFGLQNPEAALNDARRSAMTEARARAALYAAASGLSIHRIISISEGGGYTPPMPMPMMARAMDMAEGAPTPVAPGEVRTQVQVNVVFELR